jgi:hypothetical protein
VSQGGNLHVYPDFFSPGWTNYVSQASATFGGVKYTGLFNQWKLKAMNDDPYCIGFFVDNEVHWNGGDATTDYAVAKSALMDSRDLATKRHFLDLVAARVSSNPQKLAARWGISIPAAKTWSGLRTWAFPLRQSPKGLLQSDLKEMSKAWVRHYAGTIKQGMTNLTPNKLYIGSRFLNSTFPQWMTDAMRDYVDVFTINAAMSPAQLANLHISENMNRYEGGGAVSAADERPVMISEFQFSDKLESGFYNDGVVEARDSWGRVKHYKDYIDALLKNPQIVGVHWYQYLDQAVLGRATDAGSVANNAANGLVSVLDFPYASTTDEMRIYNFCTYKRLMPAQTSGNSFCN